MVGSRARSAADSTDLHQVARLDLDAGVGAAANKCVAGVDSGGVGNLDNIATLQHTATLQQGAGNIRTVKAVEIRDLPRLSIETHKGGMSRRHRRRAQDQVVARGAADRQRVEGVEVDGAPGGLLVAQQQHNAIVMARRDVAYNRDIARREGRCGRFEAVNIEAIG